MRLLGGILFVLGTVGTGYAVKASFEEGRARATIMALAAPVALALAVAGGILVFVPRFFA